MAAAGAIELRIAGSKDMALVTLGALQEAFGEEVGYMKETVSDSVGTAYDIYGKLLYAFRINKEKKLVKL